MFLFAISFWVSIWSYIVQVFGFVFRYSLSLSDQNYTEIGSDFDGISGKPDEIVAENENEEVGFDPVGRVEIPKLDSDVGTVPSASTSKCQFLSANSLCTFIEEPQTMSFTVQEMFVISNDDSSKREDFLDGHAPSENDSPGLPVDSIDVSFCGDVIVDPNSSELGDCGELNGGVVIKQGETESSFCGQNFEEKETVSFAEDEFCEEREVTNVDERVLNENGFSDQVRLSSVSNSDDFWASIHKFDVFSDSNLDSDSDTDEMICGKSLFEALEPETPMGMGDKRVNYHEDSPRSLDDFPLVHSNSLHLGSVDVESEQETVDSISSGKFIVHSEEHMSGDEFSGSDDELEEESSDVDSKGIDASESCDGEDYQTETDALMEQKELIRRMKKEMRHLKISGLPTILEESESARVEDDLRPLKIDERIGHKDRMDEIQILYKKYLDKMRKLDILSQQSMYAIGLLQLKNQDQFGLSKKVSVPRIKSLLAQNFWSNKFRKHEADPVQKLIRDFQRDLELVYVGQVCLSWEFLKWQYHKSKELHANDPDGFRQHNQVAGDFQKFQVLLQRFTEDEPYHHGPRVQSYVKSRCSQPNLLLVPLIKDDPSGEWRGKVEGGISIGMLKEVIGASMRAFWEFLHADKEEVHATSLIGIHGVQVDLQDPSDAELLTEVRSNLQKKEKRFKDLVRSGNCIVRKFQKHRDQRLSHEMFLAQVELRLISRVLTMSRLTTDQLLWCHKKMSKINIVGRKVYLDHLFLLFPC